MLSNARHPEVFLDNNATTRPLREVRQAMMFAMTEGFGNASSGHRGGEAARRLVAKSRKSVAALVAADVQQVVFTSGATESNNWAITSALSQPEILRFITTETEHASVNFLAARNSDVAKKAIRLSVDSSGLIDLWRLEEVCSQSPAIVSVHWVNNESGVVQPIREIARICTELNCLLHVDASQAVGKFPVRFEGAGIDFMTVAAHKFHGPQGVGAICCRDLRLLRPIFFGGAQEQQLRPGTENLPGIAGFGVAAELRLQNFEEIVSSLLRLRNHFEGLVFVAIPRVYTNGGSVERICNTSNLRFEGVDGQALVAQLDSAGIRCSQSSACTAQIPEPSYVLRAMGLTEEEAYSSVRFSFSELNTFEEIEKTVSVLTERVNRLRDFHGNLT